MGVLVVIPFLMVSLRPVHAATSHLQRSQTVKASTPSYAHTKTTDVAINGVVTDKNKQRWQRLEQTHWVQDGNVKAPRIIYMFSDPHCTYCFAFRRAIANDIASGHIQLRHILVGLLTEKSHPQAATILGSDNPRLAYETHRQHLKKGGIETDPVAVEKASKWVTENTHLMVPMRTISTPTLFYKNAQGEVQVVYGFPDDGELTKLRHTHSK